MNCPKCHGRATKGGKNYGPRCIECDRFVEDCDCPDIHAELETK